MGKQQFTHSWKGGETNLLDDDLGRKEQYGMRSPSQHSISTPSNRRHLEWNGITKDDVKAWGHENAGEFLSAHPSAYFSHTQRSILLSNALTLVDDQITSRITRSVPLPLS